MLQYLNGTTVRLYAVAATVMQVFYCDETAAILQEYQPQPGVTGNLFFTVF